MRRFITFAVALMLLATISATAQVRGRARLQGTVVDAATGKPIQGAKVTATIAEGNTQPIVAKTDAKGRWSVLGLTNGAWHIDIEAAGYQTNRGSASVSEFQLMPPVKTELAPEVKQEPVEEAPAVAPTVGVSEEVRSAITQAQDLLAIKAGDMLPPAEGSTEPHTVSAEDVKQNAVKAAALIEGALPQLPSEMPDYAKTTTALTQLLGQAYYKAGNLDKAIASLETVIAADPSNHGLALLLVNLYLEGNRLAEGRALLEKIPSGMVTDPNVYLNVGILFMNKNSVADAKTYFEKAIALDATRAESFYYSGLANLQLKKLPEARADFQKVIALAPDSPEGRDAKQLLPGIK